MNTVTTNKPRPKTSAMIASIAGEGQLTRSAPFGLERSVADQSRPLRFVAYRLTTPGLRGGESPEHVARWGTGSRPFVSVRPDVAGR